MYLIDTEVICEETKHQPNIHVHTWLSDHTVAQAYLSVITLAEIEQGILQVDQTQKVAELTRFLRHVESLFSRRILPIDRLISQSWAKVTDTAHQRGTPLTVSDSWLAATALTHNLTVVTRHESGFHAAGVETLNPWKYKVSD